jgi:protoporphyrinogen oxidase
LWLEVAGSDYAMVNRLTRIYYNNRYFYYPLRPFDALSNLGTWEALSCVISYLKEKVVPTPFDETFETWTTRRFGKRLYEIFFKTYSERLWGIPCNELDADFAAQRIKKLSLYGAIVNAMRGGRGNRHKTLVDRFAYPHGGTGAFYKRMAEAFGRNSGNLHLNSRVKAVIQEGGKITGIEREDGSRSECDAVVSSMPLSLLVERLAEVPDPVRNAARALRYRNTILVYLEVAGTSLFPDQWLYIHSADIRAGRITNFRNWHPSLHGEENSSVLCFEYWCNSEDETWRAPDQSLIDLAAKELKLTKLGGQRPVKNGFVSRISRSYPIYFRGYKDVLRPIEAYLASIAGLYAVGRYGSYKYNNQDHSILMGLLAAENILTGAGHDLWSINTDYEDYQEASVITSSGLEPMR